MTNPVSAPQFDLFEAGLEHPCPSRGAPRHVPTPENILLANELKASGATWEVIASTLGVSRNTVARRYFPSNLSNPPRGRRRHAPTTGTRKIVRRAILSGMGLGRVAKLIGISVPTLHLHYRADLLR